jgi:cell shape-determining protein MreC
MKLKTRFIIFILIFSLGIFSESLFQFSPLDIFLELPNSSKLCIAKPKSFINNKEYIKKNCETIKSNISEPEQLLKSISSGKEICYIFYSENDEKLSPSFQLNKKDYKLIMNHSTLINAA